MLKDLKKQTRSTDTLIGQGSSIEGTLECESNLRIDGLMNGEIRCKGQVIIGETGEARSHIQATEIIVAGTVIGDISTKGRLTIMNQGEVIGNVSAAKLVIAEGGLLSGTSKMEKVTAPVLVKDHSAKTPQPEAG